MVNVAGAGPGDQYKVGLSCVSPDFEAIGDMCRRDEVNENVDRSPHTFSTHRRTYWPE